MVGLHYLRNYSVVGPCKTSTPETQVGNHQQRQSSGNIWKHALSMSSPACARSSLDILSDTRRHSSQMPPYSCLETVFVSDCPVTRIIPQRSVDSLHLHPSGHSLGNMWRPQSIAFGKILIVILGRKRIVDFEEHCQC